jgi:hypothetical protein
MKNPIDENFVDPDGIITLNPNLDKPEPNRGYSLP